MKKKRAEADKLKVNLAVQEKVRKTLRKRLNTTKSLDDLNERAAENTSPSKRVAGRDEELVPLRTQTEVRERSMPLHERIKEIFKKYGVTVASVFLAAGVTIGVVVSSITNGLKTLRKKLGDGLRFCLACSGQLFVSSSKPLGKPFVFWQTTPGC